MGNGFVGDPGIYANPPQPSGGAAGQPQVPTPTQILQAEEKFKLHPYSDGCNGLWQMMHDLIDPNSDSVEVLDPAIVQSLRQGLYQRSAPAAPTAFYPAMSHQQLYDSVTHSANPGQIGDMASAWSRSSERLLNASQNDASQVLASSEMTWQGQAGDTARMSVAKLVNLAGQTGQAAQVSAQLYQQQSSALAQAKNSIPKPPAQPFNAATAEQQLTTVTDPVRYLALAQQDHVQFVAQQQAQQEAARIVQQYDQVIIQTSRNQPAFAPPPQVAKQAHHSTTPSTAASGGTVSSQGGGFTPHPDTGSGGGAPSVGTGSRGASVPAISAPVGRTSVGNIASPSGNGQTRVSALDHVPAGQSLTNPFGGGTYGNDPGGVGASGGGRNAGDLSGGTLIAPVGGEPGVGSLVGDAQRTGSGLGGGAGGLGGGGGAGVGRGGVTGGGVQPGVGARSGADAAATEEVAVERGVAGAQGEAGAGGMVPGARGGKGGEDAEHQRGSYLTEPDPNDIFGTDEKTVPPVIG
jgi:hypothetical protein